MTSSELPPKPPEYEREPSTRTILIAMLGIYAHQIGREIKNRGSRVLAFAPAEHIQGVLPPHEQSSDDEYHGADEDELDDRLLVKMTERYQAVRRALDTDLENEDTPALKEHWAFNVIMKGQEKGLKRDFFAADILTLFNALKDNARAQGITEMFDGITQSLTDPSFVKRFGYESAVRGMNNETLALLPSSGSEKHHLFLGMPVSYTKNLEPSGQTGPLSGTGRITAFLIPVRPSDIIPDQVITLAVSTEKGSADTLLTPDELLFE